MVRRFLAVILGLGMASHLRADTVLTICNESSLRAAVQEGGTVTIACSAVIPLGGPLHITNQVVIDAAGQEVVLMATNDTRLIEVGATGDLTLVGLELKDGRHFGVDGASGVVEGQHGRSGDRGLGGAMLIDGGVVSVRDCLFRDNLVIGGNGGAGYSAAGCEEPGEGGFGGWGVGGAISLLDGSLFVEASTFRGNIAQGGLGGAGGSAELCAFGSDGEQGRMGGSAYGAAIYVENGLVEIENGSFFDNLAQGGDGGLGGAGAGGLGAGGDGGNGGVARGGALYVGAGEAFINSSTFAYGATLPGRGGAGGPGGSSSLDGDRGSMGIWGGEAIFELRGTIQVSNTILDGRAQLRNCGGTSIVDNGHNLSSDGSCSLQAATSRSRVDPGLQPPEQITADTLALELFPSSPALDAAGDPNNPDELFPAAVLDQFGTERVGLPDIGALESLSPLIEVDLFPLNSIVQEGQSVDFVEICRSGPLERSLNVALQLGGLAELGVDFSLTELDETGSFLTLPAGQDCIVVSLSAVQDEMIEGEETVLLELAEGFYVPGLGTLAELRIRPALRFLSRRQENGSFFAEFESVVGLAYTVQYSPNLIDWLDLESFVAEETVSSFVDPTVLAETARFFRVLEGDDGP